jgi:nitronate monooxygenase
VVEGTDRPWGVGFLSWSATPEAVEQALEHEPATVLISFGDPRELAEPVLAAGVPLMVQVTSIAEAERALEIGAHVLVAQGGEAGGHGGGRATLPFVPVVVDLAGDTPVLAAGGIADGRGVAAALVLGATGALLGTRFQASAEAIVSPQVAQALIDGHSEDTERNRVLDIARRSTWPERYTGRALRNATVDQWRGREDELAADEKAKDAYEAAVAANDMDAVPVWAGESVDLITDIPSATELVGTIATEAEQALRQATRLID